MMNLFLIAAAFVAAALTSAPDGAAALPLIAALGLVNSAQLTSLFTGFKAVFKTAFDGVADSGLLNLAMRVASTNKNEEYGWLGKFPGLREWIGARQVHELAANGYTIKNRDFEETVGVDRNDIEDDNLGVYSPLIAQLGFDARRHPATLLAEILLAGETTPCFDGQPMFAAAHPNGAAGTYSNLLAANALTADNYAAARAAMMAYTNEAGTPLGVLPAHLIVPPQLEGVARAILNAEMVASGNAGVSNVWRNSAELVVAPELAGAPTAWYLADLRRPVKPLILQMRKEPEFVSKDKPDDDAVFTKKQYLYGVDYRGAVGYGLPHLIIKGRPAA